jgi:hypothetical protein
VNGPAVPIALQGENARASLSVRVILDSDGRDNASQGFTRQNTILRKFIKAVAGDEIVAGKHERLDAA